jgi:hypothetical protein
MKLQLEKVLNILRYRFTQCNVTNCIPCENGLCIFVLGAVRLFVMGTNLSTASPAYEAVGGTFR